MVSLRVCTVFIVLVCVTSTVHGAIHQVNQNGNKFKITKVTDSTLRHALQSISEPAWNVKELDLSGNLLSQIRAADLAPFRNLELLNLSSNVFYETLDLGALQNLKTVDLNNNYVQELIVGSSIETLRAANNNISLVTCYGNSQRSKRIYLANNKIGSLLDLNDTCRTNVQLLDLTLNEIDTVDFAELAASANTLQHLYLQYNFIFDVKNRQNVVFSQLDTLDVSSNKLAFMGPEFNAASTAKSINLSNNKLVLIGATLKISQSITSFDLRGNGFQCDTLTKLFSRNTHLRQIAVNTVFAATGKQLEPCLNITQYVGPYCCEILSAPFADRLIDLKRKEHALFSNQPSEKERIDCVRENNDRLRQVDAIQQQYSTTIDAETRKNQQKFQLAQKKKALEEQLPTLQNSFNDLKDVLKQEAFKVGVAENTDLLQLLRDIVQKYEDLYTNEQNLQSNAIRDWEMYQHKETQQLEENERLKKLNGDAELALQKANATLHGLIAREQELAKDLSSIKN